MKLSFHGAAQRATGSCHLLEVNGRRILISIAASIGGALLGDVEPRPFGFEPGAVGVLLLTHAHLDHSGRIIHLGKRGLRAGGAPARRRHPVRSRAPVHGDAPPRSPRPRHHPPQRRPGAHAPAVLARTPRRWGVRELGPATWREREERLAARGERLLAVTCKPARPGQRTLRYEDLETGFTLLALFGLNGPQRAEARDAVASCQRAGIDVKTITGDHAATALAIAREVGIPRRMARSPGPISMGSAPTGSGTRPRACTSMREPRPSTSCGS